MDERIERVAVSRDAEPSSTGFLSQAVALAIVVLTWLLIYIPSLSQPGLLDDADSIHAEAAREMLLSHNWVTLYINGIRYLEKSPFMYWTVAVSYKLFGVAEWQTRLPLALGVLALALVIFIFGRRFYRKEAGFWAALITVTAPGIFLYTRFMIPDVFVALWLTLGLYWFLIASEQEQPSRWLCWGIAVTIALDVLTKSLIGIVFPVAIAVAFLFITGNLRKLLKFHLVSSFLIFLVVAVPWHVLAAVRSPAQPGTPDKGFLWFYFINEQFLRYLNERFPRDYDKVPLVAFWLLLLGWIIPWVVYVVPALREIPVRVRTWREGLDRRARTNLFCAVWILGIMLFFSFSTRQEYYSLPAIPPLALLIGSWLQRERQSSADSRDRRDGRIGALILLAAGIAGFVAAMILLAKTHSFPPGTDIGSVLVSHPSQYKLSLGHMNDLTFESFGLFRMPVLLVGLGLLIGTCLNWIFRRRGKTFAGNLALAGMMIVLLLCVHQGLVIFAPELSSKRVALEIKHAWQPGDVIVINGKYEWGSTLNYYTGIQLHMLNGRDGNLWYGSYFPGAPEVFENNASFKQLWNGPHRVFLFTEDFLADQATADIDRSKLFIFARQGGKLVLSNRP